MAEALRRTVGVLKALNPERTDRYQSALDLQREFETVLKSHGWEPDTSALGGFIEELGSGSEITDYPVIGPAAPVAAAPPVQPPKKPPLLLCLVAD